LADIIVVGIVIGLIAVAFGLSFWVYHARHDRSARVGLYLLLGLPGILLLVAGAAFLVSGNIDGLTLTTIGLALVLPLVSRFRALAARVVPIDPGSPVHMVGLAVMLATVLFFVITLINIGEDVTGAQASEITYVQLIAQAVLLVGVSYAAVGLWVERGFSDASARLGLRRPTIKTLGIAVGFLVLGFVASAFGGILTQVFQPGLTEDIDEVMSESLGTFQNPVGALAIGISAGVGEELLLRGALQPRFGILLTSALFAFLHTQYGFSWTIVGLFGVGVLLGIERKRYGTTAAIITHALYNTVAVLLSSLG